MSGNNIVINQNSGLDQININQDAPKILQVTQPVTNIVEVRSIGPQGIQGPPGVDGTTSPFTPTGSYWSSVDDIYITGSLYVTSNIFLNGIISASTLSGSFVGNGSGLTNITASVVEFSNILNKPTLISSSLQFNDLSTPFTGSYTGSFSGDGVNLYNIPASGITGLNLSRIVSGSATASISPNNGFIINVNTVITSSAPDIFLIKNQYGSNVFAVSQSGVIVLSTQSAELINAAPAGGIYFTSSSMYIGLEN